MQAAPSVNPVASRLSTVHVMINCERDRLWLGYRQASGEFCSALIHLDISGKTIWMPGREAYPLTFESPNRPTREWRFCPPFESESPEIDADVLRELYVRTHRQPDRLQMQWTHRVLWSPGHNEAAPLVVAAAGLHPLRPENFEQHVQAQSAVCLGASWRVDSLDAHRATRRSGRTCKWLVWSPSALADAAGPQACLRWDSFEAEETAMTHNLSRLKSDLPTDWRATALFDRNDEYQLAVPDRLAATLRHMLDHSVNYQTRFEIA